MRTKRDFKRRMCAPSPRPRCLARPHGAAAQQHSHPRSPKLLYLLWREVEEEIAYYDKVSLPERLLQDVESSEADGMRRPHP